MVKRLAILLLALVTVFPRYASPRALAGHLLFFPSSSSTSEAIQPGIPCDGTTPERTYLFLDCDDVRRIRNEIRSYNRDALLALNSLKNEIRTYRRLFPTRLNYPHGDGVLWWGAGHYIARDLALLYLVTGETSYADDLARLLDLVVHNTPPRDPSGGLESGLFVHFNHGAVNFQALVFGYLTIRDTNRYDDEQRQSLDEFFIGQARLLEGISPWPEITPPPTANQNVWLSVDLAEATLALAFPDHAASAGLYANAHERLVRRLTYRYDADGGWYEKTDNYASILLEGLLTYAETELKRGNNLYQVDFGGHSIHTICQWFVKVMTPIGTLPAINDGIWGALEPGLLNLCSARTGDPALRFAYERYFGSSLSSYLPDMRDLLSPFGTLAWADSTLPAAVPEWTSVLMPGTGLAVLRSGWGYGDQYLLLQFTDTAVHQHYSYGNIVLFDVVPLMLDNGYHLGVDYEDSISTRQHSTLALNNTNQTVTRSTATFFVALPQHAMVSVISEPYADFSHRRSILWITPLHRWVVVDDADLRYGSGRDRLQLRWYAQSTIAHTSPITPQEGRWLFDDERLILDLLPGLPADYRSIFRIHEYFRSGDARGVEMEVTPSVWPVRLISVMASKPQADEAVTRIDNPEGTLIQGENTDAVTWAWLLPVGFPGSAQVGDLGVNGQAGCVTTRVGDLQSYCLMGGTSLSYQGRTLVAFDLPTCSATNQGANINLRSGPGTGYAIVGTLASSQGIAANGRSAAGDWLRVVTETGNTAWIYASLVHLDCAPETLNTADEAYPSLEVDLSGGQIAIQTAQDVRVRLYWPVSIRSITDTSGLSPDVSGEGETLILNVPAGQHTFTVTQAP